VVGGWVVWIVSGCCRGIGERWGGGLENANLKNKNRTVLSVVGGMCEEDSARIVVPAPPLLLSCAVIPFKRGETVRKFWWWVWFQNGRERKRQQREGEG
jgi:hypothetical protein